MSFGTTQDAKSLRQQAAEHAMSARHLVEKAEAAARSLTDDERQEFDRHFAEAKRLKAKADTAAKDEDVLAYAKGLAREVGDPIGGPVSNTTSPRSAWSSHVAGMLTEKAATYGVKQIVSGSVDVPTVVDPGVVPVPDAPKRLLDLVIDRATTASNVFSYAREVERTSRAAPVPDGQVKPTSDYVFEEEEDRCRVFAHLTSPIYERLLADHQTIERILGDQLEADLLKAIEAQVVTGDGLGENLEGLTAVSGTVAQAFATDMFTTMRKARTTMDTLGEAPTAWALSPADAEAIDLTRDNSGGANTGGYMVNSSSMSNVFGTLPRISTPAVPAGTAILGDWSKLQLVVRQEAELAADRSGANFASNQCVLRMENRIGLAILRPASFCIVDLIA
jgi:HK97 family phage major capsid protein